MQSMETTEINLKDLNASTFELGKTSSKMRISDVFAERQGSYLNEFTLFIAHFNAIPNFVHEIDIDCKKANQWFAKNYSTKIKDYYFNKRYYNGSKIAEFDDVFYFLYEDLIVDFDTNNSVVRFLFRETKITLVESLGKEIRKFKERKSSKPKISLLIQTRLGIDTKRLEISKPKLSMECNYNDDFKPIHQTILRRLSKKNDKGLVLLHGKPGTGKTSYIRYLISTLKKDVIFLPPNMASAITNPDLISVLIDNPNSIFVIEDAENIIADREKDGNSPVSALLNISDGLLSDCLNIQVICSFNTDISKIDNALMRKGRLIAKYEFKELDIRKTQMLSEKLGFRSKCKEPMTLTAIYNQEDQDFQKARKTNQIGFKVNAQ